MNLKMRLERLCDSKQWARLYFGDGTSLTGRLLRLGHDYVEMESYGDLGKSRLGDYAKHLIPLGLLKYITVESTEFSDAERRRLQYLSELETSPDGLPELEI